MSADPGTPRDLERAIGRLLIRITYVSVILLGVGVTILLASGTSPLAGGPDLDPATLAASLSALEPGAFIWLGLLAIIATPLSRVVAAALGFARRGEASMAAISLAILAVIAVGVAVGLSGTR
jgi:uncharacterized membrane protein